MTGKTKWITVILMVTRYEMVNDVAAEGDKGKVKALEESDDW